MKRKNPPRLELDLDVNPRRKLERHERIDRLCRRLVHVDQSVVRASLEVFPAVLVNVRRAQDAEDASLRRKRHRTRDARLSRLCRLDDLIACALHVVRLERAQANANFLGLHSGLQEMRRMPSGQSLVRRSRVRRLVGISSRSRYRLPCEYPSHPPRSCVHRRRVACPSTPSSPRHRRLARVRVSGRRSKITHRLRRRRSRLHLRARNRREKIISHHPSVVVTQTSLERARALAQRHHRVTSRVRVFPPPSRASSPRRARGRSRSTHRAGARRSGSQRTHRLRRGEHRARRRGVPCACVFVATRHDDASSGGSRARGARILVL